MYELRLFLAKQSVVATIFIAYLFVVVSISIVRSLRLARLHCSFSRPRPVSLRNLIDGDINGTLLAKIALGSTVRCEPLFASHNPKALLSRTDEDAIQHTINKAKDEFRRLWETSRTIVRSIKRLVPFTLLLTCTVTIFEAIYLLRGGYMTERKIAGMAQLFEALADLLRWPLWGASISLVLFMVSSYFEENLMRREKHWKHFLSALQADIYDG